MTYKIERLFDDGGVAAGSCHVTTDALDAMRVFLNFADVPGIIRVTVSEED